MTREPLPEAQSSRQVPAEVNVRLARGHSLDGVERRLIPPSRLAKERKAALWLYRSSLRKLERRRVALRYLEAMAQGRRWPPLAPDAYRFDVGHRLMRTRSSDAAARRRAACLRRAPPNSRVHPPRRHAGRRPGLHGASLDRASSPAEVRAPSLGSARRDNPLMPDLSKHVAPSALDAGWIELANGRWDAAMVFFEKAVAAAETPEAYEGLSWAAWWRDDAGIVFDARDRAYRLYKARADAAGAARMAIWLACDQLDFRGALAVARGWLARAHRLLDPLEPAAEHGWLAFFEGYIADAIGESARSLELAARAAELGRGLGVPDLEMLGLALEGGTLVSCARVAEGMRRLDEAVAAALEGDARIPIAGAWACCFLVTACSAVRDFERAFAWCDRIAEFAERYGSRYMLAFCRAEYGAVDVWRGRWTDAERVLEASVEDFSQSRPAMVGAPLVALAELRRRQGRAGEAALLLDRAGPSSAVHLCRARLALDRGEALGAVELAERVLRQVPEHRRLDRAPALEVLVRARAARGELDEARAGRRGAARDRAAGRHDAAARVGGPCRGRGRGRRRRPRAGAAAVRGRRRRLRAQRRRARGGAGAARARDEPHRAASR
jgi:hypothetical protein